MDEVFQGNYLDPETMSPITPQHNVRRYGGKVLTLEWNELQTDGTMDFTILQIDLAEPEESQAGTRPTTYQETGENSASGTGEQGTRTTHSRRGRLFSSHHPGGQAESTSPRRSLRSLFDSLKTRFSSGGAGTSENPLVEEDKWFTASRSRKDSPPFTID
jgi:hypothetical protein